MQIETFPVTKTIQLTQDKSLNSTNYQVNLEYYPSTREFNITSAINDLIQKYPKYNNCQLFCLNINQKNYLHLGQTPFHKSIILSYNMFIDQVLKIKFKKINHSESNLIQNQSISKRKVRQRTINQAINTVLKWRNLYEETDHNGKRKYTLQRAAKEVGISKKTLDDYYYQLRQAQNYGFKLQENKHQKIGILRRFVKNAINQQQKNTVNRSIQPGMDPSIGEGNVVQYQQYLIQDYKGEEMQLE